MISYCQGMPPPETSAADGLIGCRMQTLEACYGALPGAPDWYTNDSGGVLCRFGGALLVTGRPDFNELFPFAELFGVSRVEWTSPYDGQSCPPPGWHFQSYPVLCCTGEGAAPRQRVQTGMELRRCFEILGASDAQFAREADYLPWLSDMTRRRNAGRAEAFLCDNASVACITAIGRRSAYLSSVAVLPVRRGKGRGLALLHAVRAYPPLRELTIYTAAQTGPLTAFYQKAGFEALPQRLIIAEKRIPT